MEANSIYCIHFSAFRCRQSFNFLFIYTEPKINLLQTKNNVTPVVRWLMRKVENFYSELSSSAVAVEVASSVAFC